MTKHILFTNGILAARYDVAIHGDNIPEDSIEVTDELFFQTINEQDGIWSLVDNEIVKLPIPEYVPTVADLKAAKQREIDTLEAGQYMTRGEREGWIAMVLAQATAQSMTEPTLYLSNSFYKKLKDVNTQVTLLRAELKAIV